MKTYMCNYFLILSMLLYINLTTALKQQIFILSIQLNNNKMSPTAYLNQCLPHPEKILLVPIVYLTCGMHQIETNVHLHVTHLKSKI